MRRDVDEEQDIQIRFLAAHDRVEENGRHRSRCHSIAAMVKKLAERARRTRSPRLLTVDGVHRLVEKDRERAEHVAP